VSLSTYMAQRYKSEPETSKESCPLD